jgi:hypothetical protein
MVNRVILKYFRSNLGKYPLDKLKGKAVRGGYSLIDINEALMVLRTERNKAKSISSESDTGITKPVERRILNTRVESVDLKAYGIRWMRFAGIVGFVFLLLGLLNYLASFLLGDTLLNLGPNGTWTFFVITIVLAIVVVILSFFYLYGFLKLGRAVDSRLLRVATVMNIISVILVVILALIYVVFSWTMISAIGDLSTGLENELGAELGIGGPILGNAVPDSSEANLGGWIFIVGGVFILFALFIFISRLLFSVSLIKIRNLVGFSGFAGFFGIVSLILVLISMGVVVYIMLNPISLLGILTATSWIISFSEILSVATVILGFMTLFSESLVLFDSSKKFKE